MIKHLPYNNPVFRNDSASVCYFLKYSNRSTWNISSIKLHQNYKNRTDTWLCIVRQHAEKDKYDK